MFLTENIDELISIQQLEDLDLRSPPGERKKTLILIFIGKDQITDYPQNPNLTRDENFKEIVADFKEWAENQYDLYDTPHHLYKQLILANLLQMGGKKYSAIARESFLRIEKQTRPQARYKINDCLSVGLNLVDGGYGVFAFVEGSMVIQCRYATITAPINIEVQDADELIEKYAMPEVEARKRVQVTLKQEVFIHASNLQAWAENDYDVRVIHSNIAWPLLIRLQDCDTRAQDRLIEQAHKRWIIGTPQSRRALPANIVKILFSADLIPEKEFWEYYRDSPL